MKGRQVEGRVALDMLLAQASPELIATWDGGTDRVAYVIESGEHAGVGFLDRCVAVALMQRRADIEHALDVQVALRAHAATLEEGAAPKGVQCLVLGWGGVALVEINPEDLAHRDSAPPGVDIVALIDTCADQRGALALLDEARRGIGDGEGASEIDHVAETALEQWGDTQSIEGAVIAAIVASERHLATPAGQKARSILNALLQATGDRAEAVTTARINSPGGSA